MIWTLALLTALSSPAQETNPSLWLGTWHVRAEGGEEWLATEVDETQMTVQENRGPWAEDGSPSMARTHVPLEAIPPKGAWHLLGRFPEGSVAIVNGTRLEADAEHPAYLRPIPQGTLRQGDNLIAVSLPARPSSIGHDDGPWILVHPADQRWLRRTLGRPQSDVDLANFSIATTVDDQGAFHPDFFHRSPNPPFEFRSMGRLDMVLGGRGPRAFELFSASKMTKVEVAGEFPQRRADYTDPRLGDLRFNLSSSIPTVVGDPLRSSLPVSRSTMRIFTQSHEPITTKLILRMLPHTNEGPFRVERKGEMEVVHNGRMGLAIRGDAVEARGGAFPTIVATEAAFLPKRSLKQVQVDILVFAYDENAAYAAHYKDPLAILEEIQDSPRAYRTGLKAFRDRLPKSGDLELDRKIPDHFRTAFLSTPLDSKGHAHPRGLDSQEALLAQAHFYLHWFPSLERAMIEGALPQPEQDLGRMAATLLRASRYHAWTLDSEFHDGVRASCHSAMESLIKALKEGWPEGQESASDWLLAVAALESGSVWFDDEGPSGLTDVRRAASDRLRNVLAEAPPEILELCAQLGLHAEKWDGLAAGPLTTSNAWAQLVTLDPDTPAQDAVAILRAGLRSESAFEWHPGHSVKGSPYAFGLLVKGLLGLARDDVGTIHLAPWLLADRMSTHLPLPKGMMTLQIQKGLKKSWTTRVSVEESDAMTVTVQTRGPSCPPTRLELKGGKRAAATGALALDWE